MRHRPFTRVLPFLLLLAVAAPVAGLGQEEGSAVVGAAPTETEAPGRDLQAPAETADSGRESSPPEFDEDVIADEEANLRVWNRQIVVLRADVGGLDPKERAAQAAERITSLPDAQLREEVWSEISLIKGTEFLLVGVQDKVLLAMRPEDLLPTSKQTLEQVGVEVAKRIQEVLEAQADQRHWPRLVRGMVFTLLTTIVFILMVWGVVRLRATWRRRLDERLERRALLVSGFDLRPYLRNLTGGLVVLLSWLFILPTTYLWLTFVLGLFPYTRPWGENLGEFLTDLSTGLAVGAAGAIPGLFTVFLIFLITRFLTRIVEAFFLSVETEALEVHWLQPETAKATRRLVIVVMWLFALTVAYPYIPGSSSAAFKGVSVFVGLMVSLGATGLVNQIVSGMLIVYTRAFRPGEYVRIADVEGVVDEIGVLSTKITTRRREHITIPNALLVGSSVNNYSRDAKESGAVITTAVTIGYDVPWRQVHALLELAAERCPGVRREPAPLVLQNGLSDFYVEYQLLAHIDDPADRYVVASDLHGRIQDAFNEHGVQILSPHFLDRAEEPVVVPRENWSPPPASPTEEA